MSVIKSPCINVCELTSQGLCRGCLRTRDEIALWSSLSDEQRQMVMDNLETRRDTNN